MRAPRLTPSDKNYVNNKEFTAALDAYSRSCREAEANGLPKPRMSNYIGSCIMKMSERLSLSPRFRNYSYRDEMIHNGILACVKYADRFDGDRFNNAFNYITQILFSHFIITIKLEKKKYETNLKLIQNAEVGVMGLEEFDTIADLHSRAIADQKLMDIENSKVKNSEKTSKATFGLKTGYTKKSRDSYTGGTPINYDDDSL